MPSSSDNQEPALVFSGLPPHFLRLIRELPICPEIENASARLFPPPSEKGGQKLLEDWNLYVRPDLQSHFMTVRQIVQNDLEKIRSDQTGSSFSIPYAHMDAWVNALNQARLAIACAHGLTEEELDNHPSPPDSRDPVSSAVNRIHFYGHLQQILIEQMENLPPSDPDDETPPF